ncbi:hypothetical protein N0V93_007852 [Gnomoniopsis smithogilvyi]|uniref:AAA+ ATPase domain-containing protein n=1 Tax=Gnomoniopsis smithogilvyi TaxID=1191159 RepID=A0A9W8YN28_9PEZI|nr:hypothetical protein N0V93_007852 [Gnomoniopsis smithogilvyi]
MASEDLLASTSQKHTTSMELPIAYEPNVPSEPTQSTHETRVSKFANKESDESTESTIQIQEITPAEQTESTKPTDEAPSSDSDGGEAAKGPIAQLSSEEITLAQDISAFLKSIAPWKAIMPSQLSGRMEKLQGRTEALEQPKTEEKLYRRKWESTVKQMTMQDWAKNIDCEYDSEDEKAPNAPIMKAYYRASPFKLLVGFVPQVEIRLKELSVELEDAKSKLQKIETGVPPVITNNQPNNTIDAERESTEKKKAIGEAKQHEIDISERLSYLQCYHDFVQRGLSDRLELREKAANGTLKMVAFADLWLIFRPGDIIFEDQDSFKQMSKVFHVTGGQYIRRRLHSREYDSVQTAMAYRHRHRHDGDSSDEEEEAPETTLTVGSWTSFSIDTFVMAFDGTKIGPVEVSRVTSSSTLAPITRLTLAASPTLDPDIFPGVRYSWLKRRKVFNTKDISEFFTEAKSMQEQRKIFSNIDHSDEARTSGWKDLIIPEEYREILVALVENHTSDQEAKPGHDQNLVKPDNGPQAQIDLIRGKGEGLIILLHGPPGSGKTSTAETIAAYTNRPLYAITCGDLGTTPNEVEMNLNDHMERAGKWGCILFLTTNRIGVIDEAFKSRIHIVMQYPRIDLLSTLKMWDNIMNRLERNNENSDLKIVFDRQALLKYAESHFHQQDSEDKRWNGRQIRNAFQSALALGHYDRIRLRRGAPEADRDKKKFLRVKLSKVNFKKIAETARDFEDYILNLRGEDSSLALNEELRDDKFDPKVEETRTPAATPTRRNMQLPLARGSRLVLTPESSDPGRRRLEKQSITVSRSNIVSSKQVRQQKREGDSDIEEDLSQEEFDGDEEEED